MASPLPSEDYEQGLAGLTPQQRAEVLAGLEAAKNFDLSAYQAQYKKAQDAQDAALKAAQATGLSDQYTQLYGGADIVPGMTQGILSNLGIENPYLPVYTLRGSANKGGDSANERMSFAPLPGMEYRLVDKNTGQTMTASTPEEIKALAEAANALGKSGGPMANYAIESGQGGKFSTMYEDRPDISKFDRLAGMALPIAVSLIPGLQGVGAVLAGAGAGGAGAAIAGGDPLKGAIMGGLTAGGTQFLPKPLTDLGLGAKAARAAGAGIGATAGGIATGQSVGRSLLGGALAGGTTYLGGELFGGDQPQSSSDVKFNNPGDLAYGTTNAANAANNLNIIGQNAAAQLASAGLPTTSFSVFTPPSVTPSAPSAPTGAPRITVTGTPVSTGAAPAFTVNLPNKAVGGPDLKEIEVMAKDEGYRQAEGPGFAVDTSGLLSPEIIATAQKEAGITKEEPSLAVLPAAAETPEIIATAQTEAAQQPKDNNLAVNVPSGTPEIVATAPKDKLAVKDQDAVGGPLIPVKSDIVVTGAKDTPKFDEDGEYVGPLTNIPSLVDDALQEELAGKKTPPKEKSDIDKITDYMKLLGLALPLLGGGGGGKGSAGKYSSTGRLSSTFTDKLPTPGQNGAFTVGGLGGTAADNTFAARPVADYYRYGMGRALDVPEDVDLSRATSPYAGYGPGTLGEETFRAVSGIPEKPVGMAHGGDMGYSRGSSRESFAVNGPGTGRSDDIPAVLSDGEYVIDAETVALLGDGSSKAGAKKLDEMRVSIRKHKGKNLAKGKFSVNAKRPEAYMSGGRI